MSKSPFVIKHMRKKIYYSTLERSRVIYLSSLDREDNKPFSFGRRETQKITWSDNPPIKVPLFWSRHESKKVTGTGHYASTSWRTQEAGKTTDAMAWQHQGSNLPTTGRPKRSSTR